MLFRILLCLAPIWWSVSAYGATVAFLELRFADGKLVQLEPGGRFAHVAIKAGNKWLHAHTERGVDLVEDIRHYGADVVYLTNDSYPEPSEEYIRSWLGKPFDRAFRWYYKAANYCTRLVATWLGVQPRPMGFSAEAWKNMPSAPRGRVGLSPDELFEELIQRGFTPVKQCEELLE